MIVELDGWNFHHDRYSFEDDRERDAETATAGNLTVRIMPERLRRSPDRQAARLAEILAVRRGR